MNIVIMTFSNLFFSLPVGQMYILRTSILVLEE